MRSIVLASTLLACFATLFAFAVSASTPGYEPDTRAYNLAHGRVVFTEHCLGCHGEGRQDAPMLSESEDWVERLEQPLDTLISHAITGHGGMPARGDTDLTDQEVAAAVAYVVNRTRLLVAEQLNDLPPTGAGSGTASSVEPADDVVLQMFLLLLGKDRWK